MSLTPQLPIIPILLFDIRFILINCTIKFINVGFRVLLLLMLGAEYYIGNAQQRRTHDFLYTEPFLMVPASFESWRRGLSNDSGIARNGSVYRML